jgi:hypothetical protein
LVELTQIYQNKVPNYWNTNYLSVNTWMWSNTNIIVDELSTRDKIILL